MVGFMEAPTCLCNGLCRESLPTNNILLFHTQDFLIFFFSYPRLLDLVSYPRLLDLLSVKTRTKARTTVECFMTLETARVSRSKCYLRARGIRATIRGFIVPVILSLLCHKLSNF